MNKRNQWMVLSLCGLTIAGCMSLEERLASNDAGVRRDAEYELIQQAYKKGSQQDRLAAIARVSDQELLFGLAMKSQENTAKEGAAAVQKLTDASQVLQVAKESVVPDVGATALSKVNNVASYADIAQRAKTPAVRAAAYEKITDQNQLLSIAQETKDKTIKLSAIKRVSDKEKLLPIVFASTSARPAARPAAQSAKDNPDNEKRMMAEKMNVEKKMMAEKMAIEKKMGGAKGAASKPAATATAAATVDAELVDAFIANCAKDDVLIKMVRTYGDKLSVSQCEQLRAKSKNTELYASITSIADIKAANALRDKIGRCIESDVFLEEYKKIQDAEVRGQLFCDEVSNIAPQKGWDEIIDLTTDKWVANAIKKAELNGSLADKKNIAYHVKSSRVPALFKLTENEPEEVYVGFLRMLKDQADVVAVINTVPENVLASHVGILAEKIMSPEAAEAFLAHNYVQYAQYKDDKRDVIQKMAWQVCKVGDREKQRVMAAAKKHRSEHDKEACIGPFYVGMSLYEAKIVAEAEGLYSKKPLIEFYMDNEDPDSIMKDWKKNLRVKKIAFTMKGALKYLDCEDALVLQQAIKQCVKKESGNATALDYLGEIKHDIKIDSSTRINLFSPTGTSTDYESEIWTSYSNTRMGVKLLHGKKSGTLILEAL